MRVPSLLTATIAVVACNALYIRNQEAYSTGNSIPIQERPFVSNPNDVLSQRLSPGKYSGSGPLGQMIQNFV